MRVGGVTLDPQFCKHLWMVLFGTVSALGLLVSFSAAVLFFTAFCFGAGLLSIALDLSNGHQLPNILPSFRPPKLLGDFLCGRCKRKNCFNHFQSEPWDGYTIPVEADDALGEFFERIIHEYMYPWYQEVSYDEDFVQEVRHILRYASSILLKRFHRVNVTQLLLKKAIPIGVSHLDALIHSDVYMEEVYGSKINKNKNIILNRRDAFLDYVGPNIHPAVYNRAREVEYVRCVTAKILPFLMPKRFQESRVTFNLMADLLSGAVLQPLLDILPNPDMTINLLIELGFSPEPSKIFEKRSGKEVLFLNNFVTIHHTPSQSALQMDLSAILKNQSSLFAFMKFLKEENALNQLQFCLSVEDFNKRIMTPELTTEELATLHKEATDLYDLYFRSNAKHKVNVDQDIAMDIFKILNGPVSNVTQLRTTTPLFKAYEEVYSNLETKMCPVFYKSEEYFTFLLGNRQKETSENCDKHISKDAFESIKTGKVRSLSKIRRDVLGKPMEGIIDTNISSAFDVANIYDQTDADDTLVGSMGDIGGVSGSSLGSVFEYRDLSAWRVSIPRLRTSTSGGKHCFVYVIDVQRIDIRAVSENAEDLHWTVQRQYSEFYALESKLTEFHGEFEDVRLPPKVKIFFNKGLDVMQSKIKMFEEYLIGLLQKPALKGSDLLFTFLTSADEFTVAASYLGMGKMIKNVPIKLTKEKGQSLQPFIDSFVASTLSQSSKPRYDSVIGNPNDKDATTERIINKHDMFEDNFSVNEELKIGTAYKYFSHKKSGPEIIGTYDTLVYLAASLFRVPIFTLQLMLGVGIIIKNTFDHIVEYAIASKLSQILCCRRVAFLCRLTEEALFEPSKTRTSEEKKKRKAEAFRNFQNFIRPLIQWITGKEKFESGTTFIFNALQDPIINKQLAILLFDQIILELFPELAEKS